MKSRLCYVYAILAVPLAILLRYALMPLIGPGVPYVSLFVVTTSVAVLGGLGPAVVTGILGAILTDYFFIAPLHTFDINLPFVSQMAVVIVTSAFIGYVGDALRVARVKAEEQTRAIRESQQRLKYHIENSPLAVVEWDANFIVTQWSSEAHRIFGWTKEEVLGKRIDSLNMIHNEDIPIVERTMERLTSGKDITVVSSNRNLTKSGEVIECTWHNSVLLNAAGQMESIMSLVEDITARKQAEEEVRRTRDDLIRSNKDLEQFAYVASHDLQEPLRAVAGFVELLRRNLQGSLDAKAAGYMDFAVDGAKRMQTLVNGLLEYSRIGTHGEKHEDTDAKAAVDMAMVYLRAAIQESGAEVMADELPRVHCDAVQLAQLFQNLIGNAIKFRGKEAPRVYINADRNGGSWRFAVSDNGIGIEPEYTERIFLIFQRLHDRDTYPGTGIGLAICKKIVEHHNGKIWVESKPGIGSTFYFTIPDKGTN